MSLPWQATLVPCTIIVCVLSHFLFIMIKRQLLACRSKAKLFLFGSPWLCLRKMRGVVCNRSGILVSTATGMSVAASGGIYCPYPAFEAGRKSGWKGATDASCFILLPGSERF